MTAAGDGAGPHGRDREGVRGTRPRIELAREGRGLEDALRIRARVFVGEHEMFEESDIDQRDEGALHLVAYVGRDAAGAVRVNEAADGSWAGSRLAVLPAFRTAGVGTSLIRAAEALVSARGGMRFTALVRSDCATLFERGSWIDEGEGPIVSGVPHRVMRSSQMSGPLLLTAGYQGLSLEGFIAALKEAGAGLLLDVRWRASSRSPGFAKTALRRVLAEAGVAYEHLPALGCPPDVRSAYLETGDLDAFSRGYLAHLATKPDELAGLARLVRGATVCLMCMEADPRGCHRSLLADELSRADDGLVVVDV